MRVFAAICSVTVIASGTWAADLTSIDLLPTNDWRYLHNPNRVDHVQFSDALHNLNFYRLWATPGFSEQAVATIDWQTTSLPFEYMESGDPLEPSRYASPLFMRKTFTVPDQVGESTGLVLEYIDAATVFLDGKEVTRLNCCTDPARRPIGDRVPEYLDRAIGESYGDYEHIELGILTPGEHTIAVAVHHHSNASQSQRLNLDARVYAPGNERLWISKNYANASWNDSSNWGFGLPDENSFVVLPDFVRTSPVIDESVRAVGVLFEGPHTLAGSGDLGLGNAEQTGVLAIEPQADSQNVNGLFDVSVKLHNDSEFRVGADSLLSLQRGLESRGHLVTKTGPGELRIDGAESMQSSVLQLNEGTLGPGRFHGEILSAGGAIELGTGSLSVRGDVTSPVSLSVGFDSGNLDGAGGNLLVSELVVDVPIAYSTTETESPSQFEIFRGWDSVAVENVRLPNMGISEWDTSKLQQGVLILSQPEGVFADCDFDLSGSCSVGDLQSLLGDVAESRNTPRFDLNGDKIVDLADRDAWLVLAGNAIGAESFLVGDSNLDGVVDYFDLNTIGQNWQRNPVAGDWSNGDFNADGIVNALDLGSVGANWFSQIERLPPNAGVAVAVPEPTSFLIALVSLAAVLRLRRE